MRKRRYHELTLKLAADLKSTQESVESLKKKAADLRNCDASRLYYSHWASLLDMDLKTKLEMKAKLQAIVASLAS